MPLYRMCSSQDCDLRQPWGVRKISVKKFALSSIHLQKYLHHTTWSARKRNTCIDYTSVLKQSLYFTSGLATGGQCFGAEWT